jgi:hypothetical protein
VGQTTRTCCKASHHWNLDYITCFLTKMSYYKIKPCVALNDMGTFLVWKRLAQIVPYIAYNQWEWSWYNINFFVKVDHHTPFVQVISHLKVLALYVLESSLKFHIRTRLCWSICLTTSSRLASNLYSHVLCWMTWGVFLVWTRSISTNDQFKFLCSWSWPLLLCMWFHTSKYPQSISVSNYHNEFMMDEKQFSSAYSNNIM